MMLYKFKNNKGYTLIGLMQGMMISLMISVAGIGLMNAGNNLMDIARAKMNDSAPASIQMIRDLRGAMNPVITHNPEMLTIELEDNTIQYFVNTDANGKTYLGKFITEPDGDFIEDKPIAYDVQSVDFEFDNTGQIYQRIDITINFRKSITSGLGNRSDKTGNDLIKTSKFTVALRNSRVL